MSEGRQHEPPVGGARPTLPPPKPADARQSVVPPPPDPWPPSAELLRDLDGFLDGLGDYFRLVDIERTDGHTSPAIGKIAELRSRIAAALTEPAYPFGVDSAGRGDDPEPSSQAGSVSVDREQAQQPCDHEWVDMTNEVIQGGELCVKCWAIRAAPRSRR